MFGSTELRQSKSSQERSESAGRKRTVSESELPLDDTAAGDPAAGQSGDAADFLLGGVQPAAEADQLRVVFTEPAAAEDGTEDVAGPQDTAAANGAQATAGEADGQEAGADEDADPIQQFKSELRTLPGDWYVVHSYAGYENRVRTNLESRTQSLNMEDYIFQIEVPTHEVIEIKSGKRQQVQEKVLPGYILVRMDLTDESWAALRNTPGVTGFVGLSSRPSPLSIDEDAKARADGVRRHGGPAGRHRAGPARRQHHGLRQAVQRGDGEPARQRHPGGDHDLRGQVVQLHHQDPAGA